MALTIDELQIEIQARSTNAASGVDSLVESLTKLRTAVRGGVGLTTATKQFRAFSQAVQALQVPAYKFRELVDALKPLEEIGKSRLGTAINQLRKIPEVTKELAATDMSAFAQQIQHVVTAILPLSAEMEKVALGFSKLPANIQRAINANAKLTTSNRRLGRSYGILGTGISSFTAKLSIIYLATRRVAKTIANWIDESTSYVEDLNLFHITMGKYAESAKAYAEKVGDLLGLDPRQFMRYQGVFQNMVMGFGVASDKAVIMSKNLTQLGYDLASVFNVKFDVAMEKLQSAISGQPRPMREWGFDMSEATLKAVALNKGITKNVETMTQMEKSQLRYVQLLETAKKLSLTGDLARTIHAPANALRVLAANATLAARSLGNIFIPALNAVLPYAIAFLKVIRTVADAIANLFGFALPEIDYSGLSGLAGSGEDAEDALSDAAKAAKDLKNALLGIDELNVINPDTGKGKGTGIGGDLGLKLPEYDFLGSLIDSKVNDLADKMHKNLVAIYETLKPFEPLLKGVAAAFATAFAFKWLAGALAGAGKLTLIAGSIVAIKKALATAAITFMLSKDPILTLAAGFSSLWMSLTSFLGGLSPFAKIATAAVAMTATFVTAKGTISDLTKGNITLGEAILNLVPIMTVAGVAMYGMFGPAGLVIGAIVAVTGAVIGFNNAQKELQREFMEAAFFDGVGISINTLNSYFSNSIEEITGLNSRVIELGKSMDENSVTINKAGAELQVLTATLGVSGVITGEEVGNLKTHFQELYNAIKANMSNAADIILTSLAGALKTATPEVAEQIDFLIGEYMRFVRETQGRAGELRVAIDNAYDSLTGLSKRDPAYQETMGNINAMYQELGALSGGMSDAAWQWQQTVDKIQAGKIDFGSSLADATQTLNGIKETGANALSSLVEARDNSLKAIDEQIAYAAKYRREDVSFLGDIRQTIQNDYARQEGAIKQELSAILGAFQMSLNTRIDETAKATAPTFWQKFSAWWISPDRQTYQNTITESIKRDLNASIGQPIQDKLTEMATTFGVQANQELGKQLMAGVGLGISQNTNLATDAMNKAANDVSKTFADQMGIRSPSVLYQDYGLNIMQGLGLGIGQNTQLVTGAFDNVLNSLLAKMEIFTNRMRSALNDMLRDFAASMASVSIKSGGNVDFVPARAAGIQRFASGGFPVSGQLFLANENGIAPEMVGTIGNRTAVANNDQIVQGVAGGVAKANAEQNALLREQNQLLRSLLEKETSVQIGDEVVGRANARYENRRGPRMGKVYADSY